ncbi:MAG TPA: protein-L-isoaspartate(D-aspartate) O-methyltransferase [Candidatus Acidoferrales bacterium]|nr:protein-L-isoaspartate(D-aspartate) O-methyltransferase [Candidatus Acidoferrales bacterium]
MSGNGDSLGSGERNFESARREMVARQIRGRGITGPRVIEALSAVPRHLFVPSELASRAYADEPLSIGEKQTISQPFIVGSMTDSLALDGSERVLEIGAGSGYQAAVLSLLVREVIAVEAIPALAAAARDRLCRLGYANVRIVEGDGSMGWPDEAPYDAILVTAAAPAVPPPVREQLANGGRLLIPLGKSEQQELVRMVRRGEQFASETLYACRFVPLTGRYGYPGSAMRASGA